MSVNPGRYRNYIEPVMLCGLHIGRSITDHADFCLRSSD